MPVKCSAVGDRCTVMNDEDSRTALLSGLGTRHGQGVRRAPTADAGRRMTSVTGALGGRVAWVTGSSRGLGRVIAAYLASLGARVVVHGTTPTSTRAFDEADSLAAVANEIATAYGVETL